MYTPKGVEKQLDYIMINRRYLSCSRDAEANVMIHMGSDLRSVYGSICDTGTEE